MRPREGDLISGKYRLVRLIGDGGMGSVFEARHEYLGTAVALKFLHPELAKKPGLVPRFLQEARLSASIKSPHIVHVTDVDQAPDGAAYIVMEMLEGHSLQHILSHTRRLPLDTALDYTVQMLAGLEAAHAIGVVHRDLKPDNVFVVALPQGPFVKLLDFGIAKLRNSREVKEGLTRPGVIMGTPEYMAPEQAISSDGVDARADVYAVGTILYEMLAGRRAVDGDDVQEIAAFVLARKVRPLRELAPEIPEMLAQIVHRAMAPLPEERWSRVADLRDMLVPFCGVLSPAGRWAVTPPPSAVASPAPYPPPAASLLTGASASIASQVFVGDGPPTTASPPPPMAPTGAIAPDPGLAPTLPPDDPPAPGPARSTPSRVTPSHLTPSSYAGPPPQVPPPRPPQPAAPPQSFAQGYGAPQQALPARFAGTAPMDPYQVPPGGAPAATSPPARAPRGPRGAMVGLVVAALSVGATLIAVGVMALWPSWSDRPNANANGENDGTATHADAGGAVTATNAPKIDPVRPAPPVAIPPPIQPAAQPATAHVGSTASTHAPAATHHDAGAAAPSTSASGTPAGATPPFGLPPIPGLPTALPSSLPFPIPMPSALPFPIPSALPGLPFPPLQNPTPNGAPGVAGPPAATPPAAAPAH